MPRSGRAPITRRHVVSECLVHLTSYDDVTRAPASAVRHLLKLELRASLQAATRAHGARNDWRSRMSSLDQCSRVCRLQTVCPDSYLRENADLILTWAYNSLAHCCSCCCCDEWRLTPAKAKLQCTRDGLTVSRRVADAELVSFVCCIIQWITLSFAETKVSNFSLRLKVWSWSETSVWNVLHIN